MGPETRRNLEVHGHAKAPDDKLISEGSAEHQSSIDACSATTKLLS